MSPVMFLVLGGSILGLAVERWGLHRQVAARVVARVRPQPGALLFAVMAVTALLSMLVTNTATTVMMLPIATAIAVAVAGDAATGAGGARGGDGSRYLGAMLLSVSLAAHIGGCATPIGTPVNATTIATVERLLGYQISFLQWMAIGLPLVLLTLPLAWWIVARSTYRLDLREASRERVLEAIGPVNPLGPPQRRVLAILALAVACWVGLPLLERVVPHLEDGTVAIVVALLLCVVPSGETGGAGGSRALLGWETVRETPWHVILMLGGGLALADAMASSGLAAAVSAQFGLLAGLPLAAQLLAVVAVVILVTEFASNQGTAALFVPIAATFTGGAGVEAVALAVAAGLAAGWGHANPAGTPSHALVLGTGRVAVRDVIRAGLRLDLVGVLAIALVCALVVPRLALLQAGG
jgi:sodium-dependent dicarboxylate transporter 2/3/5